MIAYIGMVRPYKENFVNYLESFNEVCILGIAYHLCVFTDFVPDDNLQYQGGWSVVVLTTLNLLVNTVIILVIVIGQLKLVIKRLWNKYKFKKAQKM